MEVYAWLIDLIRRVGPKSDRTPRDNTACRGENVLSLFCVKRGIPHPAFV